MSKRMIDSLAECGARSGTDNTTRGKTRRLQHKTSGILTTKESMLTVEVERRQCREETGLYHYLLKRDRQISDEVVSISDTT